MVPPAVRSETSNETVLKGNFTIGFYTQVGGGDRLLVLLWRLRVAPPCGPRRLAAISLWRGQIPPLIRGVRDRARRAPCTNTSTIVRLDRALETPSTFCSFAPS